VRSGVVHPNIVPLKGFTMEPCCCIVTEFMEGGNLWDFIKSEASGIFYANTPHTHARHYDTMTHRRRLLAETALTWPLRLKIAKDVAKGMAFLHSMNPPIMHRDLKTPNIMVGLAFFSQHTTHRPRLTGLSTTYSWRTSLPSRRWSRR
jgi:serine/threonine protein kinase